MSVDEKWRRETALLLGRDGNDKAWLAAINAEIEHVIWSKTGYPCFWPDASKSPEENFRAQLAEYFSAMASVPSSRR